MSTIFNTKNDIAAASRAKLVDLLNTNLANAIDLALQSKQAHWNVKGTDFIALHELFDQVYTEATAWVDLIAERAVQLGGVAKGTLASVSSSTALGVYDESLADGPEHVEALSSALSVFGGAVRSAIDASGKLGDDGTADLFTEVSRAADKMLWFVEAHQQSK